MTYEVPAKLEMLNAASIIKKLPNLARRFISRDPSNDNDRGIVSSKEEQRNTEQSPGGRAPAPVIRAGLSDWRKISIALIIEGRYECHKPDRSAAIHSRHNSASSRSLVASGSAACFAFSLQSAAFFLAPRSLHRLGLFSG